jgi:hypothetical protein
MHGRVGSWTISILAALAVAVLATIVPMAGAAGQTEGEPSQIAVLDDSVHPYLSDDRRGPPRGGGGVDGDGPPQLQPASADVQFSDFELNGISFADWQDCRDGSIAAPGTTVRDCLEFLIGDGDLATVGDIHPGEIGGDVFAFDVTIENTSANAVLTTFAFQSKFSESPALGSRIGDKLFTAVRTDYTGPTNGLVGVKKNGTANGLYGGKVKAICINSSTDYPALLNAGTENETLECAGGRTFDFDTRLPILVDQTGGEVTAGDGTLPRGLLPGQTMTMRISLDTSTDDGALQRQHDDPASGDGFLLRGPLTGTVAEDADGFPSLSVPGTVVDLVDFGDVKIWRNDANEFQPSFATTCTGSGASRQCEFAGQDQNMTVPRRNWGFTDILDTRDTWPTDPSHPDREIVDTLADPGDGVFSFLDVGNLEDDVLNFASILFGFGEHGADLDPSCGPGGGQQGACGGEPYVPFAEFYALDGSQLVRQEVEGSYSYDGSGAEPVIGASIDTATAPDFKTTDPFETPGQLNPGTALGGSATYEFSDFVTISDDLATVPNEGGVAGGDRFRFTMTVTNTSPAGSGIHLYNAGFQTKERALTDVDPFRDGFDIVNRQDLRTAVQANTCDNLAEVDCWNPDLGIGHYPNVIGNALLSAQFAQPDPLDGEFTPSDMAPLNAIKKNGPFQPLADGNENFICVKAGDPDVDQDAVESCDGDPGSTGAQTGLAPGQSQTFRLELDYGDFRGLILEVEAGTLFDTTEPGFGLIGMRGDFDCRDQRRLPFCHPDLTGSEWFDSPLSMDEVVYVTVHQRGDAATAMDYEDNFGQILAIGGFVPIAEFSKVVGGELRTEKVLGEYGGFAVTITQPAEGATVSGDVELSATPVNGIADSVGFQIVEPEGAVVATLTGTEGDGDGIWTATWDSAGVADGTYTITATAETAGGDVATDVVTVTVSNAYSVTIVAPDDGAEVVGEATVSAETFGVATGSVAFDFRSVGSAGLFTPIDTDSAEEDGWSVSWDLSAVVDGDYEVRATAASAEGGLTATDSIEVEVNRLGVTIVDPVTGTEVSGDLGLLAVTDGAVPATEVTFTVDHVVDGNPTTVTLEATAMGDDQWAAPWDASVADEGTEATITADAANGTETAADSVTVTIGTTEPPNNPPSASFTFVCSDMTCTFDGGGSSDGDGTIVSHDWDFDDGGSGSGEIVEHTFAADGTYTVTLTVTDDDGATASESADVTVPVGGSEITLDVDAYRVRGIRHADLSWSGATTGSVEVRRNGNLVATTVNDGLYTDNTGLRGNGSATYQVCETGGGGCSDEVTVGW